MNILTALLTVASILLVLTPLLVIGISAFVPRDQVITILERFMVLVESPFDMLRNIFRSAFQFIWGDMIKRGLNSVGITKEHWIQRSFGAVLLSITCLLGVVVMVLNNVLTFEGLFGLPIEESVSQFLPVSVEVFMGIELIVAIFAAGAMILDLMGISHLIKYLSKDFLHVSVRWILGSILSVAFIGGIYLTVMMGVVRTNSIFGDSYAANTNVSDNGNTEIIIPDVNSVNDGNLLETMNNDNISTPQYSEAEKENAGIIMKGIPLVSNITGFFSGLGFIPLCAMIITLPLLVIEFVVGFFYLTFSLFCRLINLLYNFLLAVFNALISAGQSLRNMFIKKDSVVVNVESLDTNVVVDQNNNPDSKNIEQVQSDVKTDENIDDKNIDIDDRDLINSEDLDNYQVEIIPENSKSFNPLA